MKFTALAAKAAGEQGMFQRVLTKIVQNGRQVIDGFQQNIALGRARPKISDVVRIEKGHYRILKTKLSSTTPKPTQLQQIGFSKYLWRSSVKNLATELRRKYALRLQSGSFPVVGDYRGLAQRLSRFAFVSMGLATGAQLQAGWGEEPDTVCDTIRDLFKGSMATEDCEAMPNTVGQKYTDYEFGSMIAKGCCAAVYEAKLRNQTGSEGSSSESSVESDGFVFMEQPTAEDSSSTDSDSLDSSFESYPSSTESTTSSLSDLAFGRDSDYDLAIKMMFNFEAESTACAILQCMWREVIPAKMADVHLQLGMWDNGNHVRKKRLKRLPPHPNIIDMTGVFVDDMPWLPGSETEYPDALPARLNIDGCGRNKTMFLVMKRYPCTLREYLQVHTLTVQEGLVLLAQLVEAVVHMNKHGIAHRDLKSDNILLDTSCDPPQLVVGDFGCCTEQLCLPYPTPYMDKGGNASLMAPEIMRAQPGLLSYLDYRKSDIWAVGALAYEIFGTDNPFYRSSNRQAQKLSSDTYQESDLPNMPDHIPPYIQVVVHMMLTKDLSKRPDAGTISNILQVLLWSPNQWKQALVSGSQPPSHIQVGSQPPSHIQLKRWLLTLSAEVICQRLGQRSRSLPSTVENQLKCMFLHNLNMGDVRRAVDTLWCRI